MSEQKFFICKHCGNLVGMINNSGVPIICCGEPMQMLLANTEEASHEKHLPFVTKEDHKIVVKVGAIDHPMLDNHYIQWVYMQTENGGQRHAFKSGDKPEWTFCGKCDKPVAVYAYCNLHGLWKVTLD